MRLKVLGCHGGESPSHRPASFLIDDELLLDAGAVTRSLSLGDQARIETVFLSHSHMDHLKGLPLLCDNVVGKRQGPIEIVATAGTADTLEQHLFNGKLWPDFTRIPSPEAPTVRIRRIPANEKVRVKGFELFAVPVHHTVECHGIIVSDGSGSIAYTGDTGPTDAFWAALNEWPKLRAVLCEVSFPNAQEALARVSGHLTPALLASELEKMPAVRAPIYVSHVKPGQEETVRQEIAALGDPRLRFARLMEEIVF
jgi:ribonuclease BN (tRNA processing enzyme)